MKVVLSYGKAGLEVDLPENLDITIARPKDQGKLDDPANAIKSAIDNPLDCVKIEDLVSKCGKKEPTACIVISDHTRPVPSKLILSPILETLEKAGIPTSHITILVATGLHRGSTDQELERMVGSVILNTYKIINHDAKDLNQLRSIGKSRFDVEALINKNFLDADIKIITGYTDPHFFAGFAGGRKAIVPGIAGEKTIMGNHSVQKISSDTTRFLVLEGNPLHEESLEIAKLAGVDFVVNVCLNAQHEIIAVAAGDLESAHSKLVNFMKGNVVLEIDDLYDIVVVNNGGYPLDLNLYQSVKSMAIGELAVKEGGIIIATNELSDGFGSKKFKEIIEKEGDPTKLIQKLVRGELKVESQWQVQILARILQKSEIFIVSSMPISSYDNVRIGLQVKENFKQAIESAIDKVGNNAKILILPAGPQLIPIFKK